MWSINLLTRLWGRINLHGKSKSFWIVKQYLVVGNCLTTYNKRNMIIMLDCWIWGIVWVWLDFCINFVNCFVSQKLCLCFCIFTKATTWTGRLWRGNYGRRRSWIDTEQSRGGNDGNQTTNSPYHLLHYYCCTVQILVVGKCWFIKQMISIWWFYEFS